MKFTERWEAGRGVRARLPRTAHATAGRGDGVDPVALLEGQAESRVHELVPIRYARMLASPFTFYRGAALVMAADLASEPNSGLDVQLCGDAHLSNFGFFGTPERSLVFDINDFDETHPGPFEWDVKRLAASFEIAGRQCGFGRKDRRRIVLAAVRGYRERIRRSARGTVLEAWYDHMNVGAVRARLLEEKQASVLGAGQLKRADRAIEKAFGRDSGRAFQKLVGTVDGRLRILADPPLIVPIEDLVEPGTHYEDTESALRELLASYQATLATPGRVLDEFDYVHMARKVVGVGSVGTRAWVALLQGRDEHDPLLLQAKEAQASVLERFLGPSGYETHGERVVRGQRLMQAAGDVLLGWQRVTGLDGEQRDFYVRQLYDWKGSVDVERMLVAGALLYAELCGETLARAHARSARRVEIAGYLGSSDTFDQAVADFSAAYADRTESDHAALAAAAASGRIEVAEPV